MKTFLCFIRIVLLSAFAQAYAAPVIQHTALESASSMGTGWALTGQHIVTNFHVIDGMTNLRLIASNRKVVQLKLVLADEKNDLAILAVQDKSFRMKPLPLALTRPRLGAQVFTIGFPHPDLMGTSPKLSSGFVSALNGLADDPRTLQVSVPVHSGNSGGPLLNMRGEVIGIITFKLNAQKMFEVTGDIPQNISYAVKVNRLSALVGELETDERVETGGANGNVQMEDLVKLIIGSVVIVAGDAGEKSQETKQANLQPEPEVGAPVINAVNRVVIYSYVEPESFYYSVNIRGKDDTLYNYSRVIADLMAKHIKDEMNTEIEFRSFYGKGMKSNYIQLEKVEYGDSVCKQHNADNIVAVFTEDTSGVGTRFRTVNYRMFDCRKSKEYRNKYSIYRNELNDTFGYEVEFNTSFRDFLLKTPPYVSWLGNQ